MASKLLKKGPIAIQTALVITFLCIVVSSLIAIWSNFTDKTVPTFDDSANYVDDNTAFTDVEVTPTPRSTPIPTPSPTPDPLEKLYAALDTETIDQNFSDGVWKYMSNSLSVEITRKTVNSNTIFTAHIYTRSGEKAFVALADGRSPGKDTQAGYTIARNNQVVLGLSTDGARTDKRASTGLLMRNGKVIVNKNKLPSLYLRDDGTFGVMAAKTTSKDAKAFNATNFFSYGPILVQNGLIGDTVAKESAAAGVAARAGFGVVEPGHYVAIVVDGNQKNYSLGMKLTDFAQLFITEKCNIAYNFDGGNRASMVFMGNALNSHEGKTAKFKQSAQTDLLAFGKSGSVPTVKDKVINDGNRHLTEKQLEESNSTYTGPAIAPKVPSTPTPKPTDTPQPTMTPVPVAPAEGIETGDNVEGGTTPEPTADAV